MLAVILVIRAAIYLPYSRLAHLFGFHPLPPSFLIALGVIMVSYVITAEIAKRIFYKKAGGRIGCRSNLPLPHVLLDDAPPEGVVDSGLEYLVEE